MSESNITGGGRDSLRLVELTVGERMVTVTVPQRDHGVIVREGRVQAAAPPLRILIGKKVEHAKRWCEANGCEWRDVPTETEGAE